MAKGVIENTRSVFFYKANRRCLSTCNKKMWTGLLDVPLLLNKKENKKEKENERCENGKPCRSWSGRIWTDDACLAMSQLGMVRYCPCTLAWTCFWWNGSVDCRYAGV